MDFVVLFRLLVLLDFKLLTVSKDEDVFLPVVWYLQYWRHVGGEKGQPLSHKVAAYLVKYKYKSGIYLIYLIAQKPGQQSLAITHLELDNNGQTG